MRRAGGTYDRCCMCGCKITGQGYRFCSRCRRRPSSEKYPSGGGGGEVILLALMGFLAFIAVVSFMAIYWIYFLSIFILLGVFSIIHNIKVIRKWYKQHNWNIKKPRFVKYFGWKTDTGGSEFILLPLAILVSLGILFLWWMLILGLLVAISVASLSWTACEIWEKFKNE